MSEGHLGRVVQVAGDREHIRRAHLGGHFAAACVEIDGEHGVRE